MAKQKSPKLGNNAIHLAKVLDETKRRAVVLSRATGRMDRLAELNELVYKLAMKTREGTEGPECIQICQLLNILCDDYGWE